MAILREKMLLVGQVNPPVITQTDYCGVYLSEKDDIPSLVRSLSGAPLHVEHNGQVCVGKVLQGWKDPATQTLWALSELDLSTASGAFAAAAVEGGTFREFSLGYTSKLGRNPQTGRLEASDKRITELSIVKNGARPSCHIHAHSGKDTRSSIYKRGPTR